MKVATKNLKKLVVAVGAVFTALAVPMAATHVFGIDGVIISSVQAAESGGAQQGAQKGAPAAQIGKPASSGTSAAGRGRPIDQLLRVAPADEDSDRPPWAGVPGGKTGAGGGQPPGAGVKKGDLFGEMVVLLRDENGVPILTADGLRQVIAFVYDSTGKLVPLLDASGNVVVIPYTAEGELATQVVVGGVTYDVYPAETDLGRLSVARSPSKVLDHALSEALSKLTSGTVTVDATGRLLVDGVTIDSPLENLALYTTYMTTGTIPGVTLPSNFNPAALLAAAADKFGSITIDSVIYINSILGINTGTTYYDFSTYNYDRETVWKDVTGVVLVKQPDGSYVPTTVNIYDVVFNSTNWTDPTAGGADDFATAANDYLRVILFLHDNEVR
jgi:hypothetical protein